MINAKNYAPWLVGLAITLFAGIAPLQADVARPQPENAFDEADTNDDGAINSEEYRLRALETFVLLDADGNGVLIISEASFTNEADFARADANGDGNITINEYLVYVAIIFEIADSSEDGKLSPSEVEAFDKRQ